MFSQQEVLAVLPLRFSVSVCLFLSLLLSEPHRNEPRPKILQSCIVPPTNYEATRALPPFISDKNNTKIENRGARLENTVKQRGVN